MPTKVAKKPKIVEPKKVTPTPPPELTTEQWKDLRFEYEEGAWTSVSALAQKWGFRSVHKVRSRAVAEGWRRKRNVNAQVQAHAQLLEAFDGATIPADLTLEQRQRDIVENAGTQAFLITKSQKTKLARISGIIDLMLPRLEALASAKDLATLMELKVSLLGPNESVSDILIKFVNITAKHIATERLVYGMDSGADEFESMSVADLEKIVRGDRDA